MFVTPAYAQAAGGAAGAFGSIIPLILIFGIMYFLLIRPQQQKLKQHKAMVEGVRRARIEKFVQWVGATDVGILFENGTQLLSQSIQK